MQLSLSSMSQPSRNCRSVRGREAGLASLSVEEMASLGNVAVNLSLSPGELSRGYSPAGT